MNYIAKFKGTEEIMKNLKETVKNIKSGKNETLETNCCPHEEFIYKLVNTIDLYDNLN